MPTGQTIPMPPERRAKLHGQRPPLAALLADTKIVPALRDPETLGRALASRGSVIYILCCDPENIGDMVRRIHDAGKVSIVNIDLMSGFARDKFALRHLAGLGVDGVISTHVESLRQAQALGLYVIQRTFLLDSAAMNHICNQLRNSTVDALELLPAMAVPRFVPVAAAIAPGIPLCGGGLITTMAEAVEILDRGCHAISTSDPQLWVP